MQALIQKHSERILEILEEDHLADLLPAITQDICKLRNPGKNATEHLHGQQSQILEPDSISLRGWAF